MTRIHWRNSPLRAPVSPSAFPARERSWQGNDPHDTSAEGTSFPRTSSMEPRKNETLGKLAAKTLYLSSLMSFAHLVLNHGERARETKPLPAKKSKTVLFKCRSSSPHATETEERALQKGTRLFPWPHTPSEAPGRAFVWVRGSRKSAPFAGALLPTRCPDKKSFQAFRWNVALRRCANGVRLLGG